MALVMGTGVMLALAVDTRGFETRNTWSVVLIITLVKVEMFFSKYNTTCFAVVANPAVTHEATIVAVLARY